MIFEFELTPADRLKIRAESLYSGHKTKLLLLRVWIYSVFLLCGGLCYYWLIKGDFSRPITFSCLIAAYFMFLAVFILTRLHQRKSARNPIYSGPQTIRILQTRFDTTSGSSVTSWRWNGVNRVLKTKSFVFLFLKNKNHVAIPLRAFHDADQVAELLTFVESVLSGKSIQLQPSARADAQPTSWPPAPRLSKGEPLDVEEDVAGKLPDVGPGVDKTKSVNLHYTYRPSDLIQFNYSFCLPAMLKSIFIRAVSTLALVTFILPLFDASNVAEAYSAFASATVLVFAYTVFRVNFELRKRVNELPHELLNLEIETDYNRFVVRSSWYCSSYAQASFYLVKASKVGVAIFIGTEHFLIVPSRCFADRLAMENFYRRMVTAG